MNKNLIHPFWVVLALFLCSCSRDTNMDSMFITTNEGREWIERELISVLNSNEEFRALVGDSQDLLVDIESTEWRVGASGLHADQEIIGLPDGRIAWSFFPHNRTGYVREIRVGETVIPGPFEYSYREPGAVGNEGHRGPY